MSQTLQTWYNTQHTRFTTEGDTAKAHLLKEAYYKTLHFEIYHTGLGYHLTPTNLIHRCCSLFEQYCWQYRLV